MSHRPHPATGRRALYGCLFGVRDTVFSSSSLSAAAVADTIAKLERRAVGPAVRGDPALALDFVYRRGDVVLWDNFSVWHHAPAQTMLGSAADPAARFMYRASVKGAPALELPRLDSEEWVAAHIADGYRTPMADIVAPTGGGVGLADGVGVFEDGEQFIASRPRGG
eukprot:SAG22_NODE_939_length_6404_cov_3.836003_6_plen_167_part_00